MVRMCDLEGKKRFAAPGVYSVHQTQKPGDRKGGEWMVRIDFFLKIPIN
jgi:hypothetical protein